MTLLAQDVTVRRGGAQLLREVAIGVEPGRVTALVGPNGAGKSTLLRVLAGDVQADRGRVILDGADLKFWDARERARALAVLLQTTHVAAPVTVRELVLLGRIPHNQGIETRRDHAVVERAMAFTNTTDLSLRYYNTLSGGERRRVQLARVLAQIWDTAERGSAYVLLDEPTASLDLAQQHECLCLLRAFAGRGAGVLIVLHELELAACYADSVFVLKDGELLAAGTPAQVLTARYIEQAFGVRARVVHEPIFGRTFVIVGRRAGEACADAFCPPAGKQLPTVEEK